MSDQVSSKLNVIASKLERASKKFDQLKRDKEVLEAQNTQLKVQLAEVSDARKSLEDNYNRLNLAKALVSKTGDKAEMKFRVNELVKEIDKCIALLNR